MTLLRTKIKREAKEVIKYTKRKVKKIAKKLSGKPKAKSKKKNPIYTDLGSITFKELLSGFDKETRNLVYDAYEPYESGNETRGIDTARPKQISDMIKNYLKDSDFTFNEYLKLMKVVAEVNQLPKNTEIYLP
jgi:hypothetical protein